MRNQARGNSEMKVYLGLLAITAFFLITGSTCQKRYILDPYVALVLDDFEDVTRSHWKNEDQFMVSRLEYTSDARVGFQAGVISMAGDRGAYRWVELYRDLDRWPDGGECVTFWARSKEPIDVYVKLVERTSVADAEQWGAKVHLTPEWQWYKVSLPEFTTRLLSGPRGNNQFDLFAVYGVGFAPCEPYWPIQFTVDQFQIERAHVTR